MKAQKHLVVETPEGTLLTVGGLAKFVERCREIGIPDMATLSTPCGDSLRRYPISFQVNWTEDL